MLLALGNGQMTRYAYDPLSFRLRRQRTQGYARTEVAGESVTFTACSGTSRQDTAYAYDLAGNIVFLREQAPGTGLTDGSVAGAGRKRLVSPQPRCLVARQIIPSPGLARVG